MTREEAILCLKGIKNYGRDTFTEQSDWQNSLDMAIEALEQEQKTGHWNEVFNDIEGEVRFYCSECNDYQMFTSNYCPNCGARMESEES